MLKFYRTILANVMEACQRYWAIIIALAFVFAFEQNGNCQQQTCNTFSYEDAIIAADKSYALKKQQSENELLEKVKKGQEKSLITGTLTIPVVVHNVHLTADATPGLGSNLSDQQVANAISFLNSKFQGMAKDMVGNNDQPIDIAFCLAGVQRYPNDDYSNLVRDIEDNPGDQDGSIKTMYGNKADYPRTEFMNIWVVNDVCASTGSCSLIGYSTLAHAHGSWYDGIVIERSAFEGIALVHETGHYLNLKHTFGPYDDYASCFNENCLTDNDCVCDTRPDGTLGICEATNFCHTDADSGPFMDDANDPLGNIMDYGDCLEYFTIGQKNRMRSAIEDYRSSLLNNMGACCSPVMQAAFTYSFASNPDLVLDASTSTGPISDYNWKVGADLMVTSTMPIIYLSPAPPTPIEICLTVNGVGTQNCEDRVCTTIGSPPDYDGCNEICNGRFDAVNVSALPSLPFDGYVPCWECSLGSPSYSVANPFNHPDAGGASLVVEENGDTEAIRGMTSALSNGKSYLFAMYKAVGFNSACNDFVPAKTKVAVDVDADGDGISNGYFPSDCDDAGYQAPVPISSTQALIIYDEPDFPTNNLPSFERIISCFEVPQDGKVYKDIIIHPTEANFPQGCFSTNRRGVVLVSMVELIQDHFNELSDITIPCAQELTLGTQAACTMTDVYYKWEKETSPGTWQLLTENQPSPIFTYLVEETTRFRLTREFRDHLGATVPPCAGLETSREFVVTVEGHTPSPMFSYTQANDCETSIHFVSTDQTLGVAHAWSIDPNAQPPITTLANPTITFPGPGTYLVTHTVENNCGSMVYSTTVEVADCLNECDCPANSIVLGNPNGPSNFSSFLQSNGGPLPDNPTGPIDVIFEGFVFVDETYHFLEGSNICMGPGAILDVAILGNLTLTGTHVRGCDKMWGGIWLGGGYLKTEAGNSNRTIIEDAEKGIFITLGGTANITGTDFNANTMHIYADFGFVQETPVADCRFIGNGNFKPPHPAQIEFPNGKTRFGIFLENAATVSIGSANQVGNEFTGLGTGISANNTNVILVNSHFENILDVNLYDEVEGHAVHVIGNGANFFRQGTSELCTVPDPQVSFNNCTTGMYFSGMNVGANRNTMFNVNKGIVVENGQHRRITICDNTINSEGTGIELNKNEMATYIKVTSNTINMGQNSPPPTNGLALKMTAILVKENDSDQDDAVIANNTGINLYNAQNGIYMNGARGYVLSNNSVQATHSQPTATYFGYRLINCSDMNLRCNKADGNYTGPNGNMGASGSTGLRATASPSVSYECNKFSDTRNGMQFDMPCDGSLILGTQFSNHHYGLQYFATGKTGKQPDDPDTEDRHGNRWYNMGLVNNGARHESQELDFRNESKYTVSNNSNYYYPTNPSPSDWIATLGGNNYNCIHEFGGCPITHDSKDNELRSTDETIALGQVNPGVYQEETQWLSDMYLFKKLHDHPGLSQSSALFQSYYTSKSNSPIGSLVAVKKGIRDLYKLDAPTAAQLDGYAQVVDENVGEIATIDEQLPTATGTVLQQLLAQRAAAVQDLQAATNGYQNLSSTVATARNAAADNLLATNNGIVTNKVYELNEKVANAIYLATIGKGISTLTEAQKSSLQDVANQCPYEGGTAVFRARNLLATLGADPVEYDDEALCQPQQSGGGGNPLSLSPNAAIGAVVFPNPASDWFTVLLERPLEIEGSLVLHNAYGLTVLSQVLDGKTANFDFNVEGLAGGIYVLNIREGKNVVYTTRLVIIK